MMLVVIADVERDNVERPVIIVSLLRRIEGEMLLHPARAERMQAADREPKRGEEIERGTASPKQ